MPKSSIEFEFKGNLAQLQRDLRAAARMAQQAARETGQATQKGFEGGLAGLFRRSPERRAELAFSRLAQDLSSGDIAGALSGFAERMSGLGLAAGIGVGASVVAFGKLREAIKNANEVHKALSTELEKPINVQLGLGAEGITKQIDAIEKALDRASTTGAKASVFIKDFLKFGPFGSTDSLANLEGQRGELAINAARLASQRAKDELDTANLKLRSVTLSEKEAALEKISLDAEQKRNAIRLDRKGETPVNLQRAIQAVNIEEKAAREEVERKFDVKQREANMESYILSLKDKGLTAEQQQTETIRARIALLQSQLRGAQTEDRLPLQNKITALQQQLPQLPKIASINTNNFDAVRQSLIDRGITNPQDQIAVLAEFQARQRSAPGPAETQAQAMAKYRKDQADAMAVYNQWRFGGQVMPTNIPPGLNVNTGDMVIDQWGFKRTQSPSMAAPETFKDIGTGIDGIKQGVDTTNQKLDQLLAAWT